MMALGEGANQRTTLLIGSCGFGRNEETQEASNGLLGYVMNKAAPDMALPFHCCFQFVIADVEDNLGLKTGRCKQFQGRTS